MPICSAGRPSLRHLALRVSSSFIISSDAAMALPASSGVAIGAPHCAMIASPMNLSSVPPWRNTTSTITVKYSLRSRATSSGRISSESAVKPRMSLNSTATVRFSPPNRTASGEPAMRAARLGAKNRSKLLRTRVSRRMRSANALFSSATAAMFEKATRKSRSSSSNRCVVVRLSTYSTPCTRSSLPMSGAHIAERTLCMRIDWPPNRSSCGALSDSTATFSSTTLRAMDCGIARPAAAPRRSREMRGVRAPSPSSSSIATRSTSRIWKTTPAIVSSSASTSAARDNCLDTSSSSASFLAVTACSSVITVCAFTSARFADCSTRERPPAWLNGRSRRMVELRMVAGVGSSLTSSEPSVASGRVTDATRNGTLPKAIVSPGLTLPSVMRAPFTNVPLLEPRSRTRIAVPSHVSSAWRREMVGSKTGRSLADARPTTSVAPSCSSKVWSPAVLVRRKGMGRNMTPAKGSGDCPGTIPAWPLCANGSAVVVSLRLPPLPERHPAVIGAPVQAPGYHFHSRTRATMPTTLVSYDDWIKHTESLGARRSDELRALDGVIRAYQTDKSAAALTRVKNALAAWKKTQGAGDAWKKSRRNKDGYVELLTTQVEKGGDTDSAWGTTPNFMHENLINARLGVLYLFSHLTVSPRIFNVLLEGGLSIAGGALSYAGASDGLNNATANVVSTYQGLVMVPGNEILDAGWGATKPLILKPDAKTKLMTFMEKVKRWFEDVAKGLLESLKEKWKCELPAALVKAAVSAAISATQSALASGLLSGALDLGKGVVVSVDAAVTKFKAWKSSRDVEFSSGHPKMVVDTI